MSRIGKEPCGRVGVKANPYLILRKQEPKINGHFETNGIYPLSVTPAEGYGSDPLTRTGKQILSHVNGNHVRVDDAEVGTFTLVEDRKDATRFDDLNVASTSALDLITKVRANHEAKLAA